MTEYLDRKDVDYPSAMQRGHVEQLTDGVYGIQYKPNKGMSDGDWISVEDRLPEAAWGQDLVIANEPRLSRDVIVTDGENVATAQYLHADGEYYTEDEWWGAEGTGDITHWMPIPELPKGA